MPVGFSIKQDLRRWVSQGLRGEKRELAASRIIEASKGRETLNLSNLGLKSLPDDICLLTSLVTLNINQNQLTSFPEGISSLTSLKNLNMSKNSLKEFSRGDQDFISLEKLNLSGNKINSICGTANFPSLKEMNLSLYKLESNSFPMHKESLPVLDVLHLGGRKFINSQEFSFGQRDGKLSDILKEKSCNQVLPAVNAPEDLGIEFNQAAQNHLGFNSFQESSDISEPNEMLGDGFNDKIDQ